MTTPEKFYNELIKDFSKKPNIQTMTFCIHALRSYKDLIIQEINNDKLSNWAENQLMVEYFNKKKE